MFCINITCGQCIANMPAHCADIVFHNVRLEFISFICNKLVIHCAVFKTQYMANFTPLGGLNLPVIENWLWPKSPKPWGQFGHLQTKKYFPAMQHKIITNTAFHWVHMYASLSIYNNLKVFGTLNVLSNPLKTCRIHPILRYCLFLVYSLEFQLDTDSFWFIAIDDLTGPIIDTNKTKHFSLQFLW